MAGRDKPPAADPQRIKALIAELSLTGPLSIGRVARRLGLSPRTLQRHLADWGLTFRGVVGEVRLEVSRTLLSMTDFKVAEIAERLGYSSPGSFTRAFTRWTGQPPITYRRRTRGRGQADRIDCTGSR